MSEPKDKIICFCNNVSVAKTEAAIRAGAHTLSAIYDQSGAGSGPCGGSCRGRILGLLRTVQNETPSEAKGPPPPLDSGAEAPEALIEAISLFNRRYYWETHEVLEHIWMDENGPPKKFYQGLIQASASLYHVLNANPKGVIKLAEEAVAKLQNYLPEYMGVPLEALCEHLRNYATEARQVLGGDRSGFNYDHLPYLMIGHEMEVPSSLQKPPTSGNT